MDILTLAAASFIMGLSLAISNRKDPLQNAFAALCAAVFVSRIGAFLQVMFASGFWRQVESIGTLAVAPLAVVFFLRLTQSHAYLTRGPVIATAALSAAGVVVLITPLGQTSVFSTLLLLYVAAVLVVCYGALLWHVRRMPPSVDRRRLFYLVIACPVALLISAVDLLPGVLSFDIAPISGLVLASLLYLILLIIAYPQLSKLHDYLVRAFVIMTCTLGGALIFFAVAFFFSENLPSLPSVIMAAFLIVISVTPIKVILKRIFSTFYPESRDVFTSLYEFDEKLEREKALMLSEMAPVMAHEIRNPLGSIKGAAQYLQSEAATEEQHKLLDVIIEEVNRLNGVVSQFLDYARPFHLSLIPVSVNALVRRAIDVVNANRQAENIEIVEEMHDGLPDVKADGQQLLQVLLNIALNAVEAMPGGGTLTFRTTRIDTDTGNAIGIMIRDTGLGIAPAALKNIFKPFFTTKERGAGLGLAICQRIIKEHGGSIRVKSLPGQGSVFFIRLPVA